MTSESNTIYQILTEQAGDLAALQAAYDSTPAGQKVASGPYKGKMRGELKAMISALESALKTGDTQKYQNIQAISSSDIGGGITRDESGNVTVDKEKAKAQSDKYMSKVAELEGGNYNPETGEIEFGGIPGLRNIGLSGKYTSVGKQGDMNVDYGNIALDALWAVPGLGAIGGLGRAGGRMALAGNRGLAGRGVTNLGSRITSAAAGAGARTGYQTARALGGRGFGAANTVRRSAGLGAGKFIQGATETAVRGLGGSVSRLGTRIAGNPISKVTARSLGADAAGGALTGTRAGLNLLGGGLNVTRKGLSTAIRNPGKTALLAAGADVAFNDGRITTDLINRGAEAAGLPQPFAQNAQSTPEDRPTTSTTSTPKVDPQAGPPVLPATPATPDTEQQMVSSGPPAQPTPRQTGGAAAGGGAGGQSYRMQGGTRRGNMEAILSDPNNPAMIAAEREIAAIGERNLMRKNYKGPPSGVNRTTADRIRAKYAAMALRGDFDTGAAAGGDAASAGGVGVPGQDSGGWGSATQNQRQPTPTDVSSLAGTIIGGAGALTRGDIQGAADKGDAISSWMRGSRFGNYLQNMLNKATGLPETEYIDPQFIRQRDPNLPTVDPGAIPASISGVDVGGGQTSTRSGMSSVTQVPQTGATARLTNLTPDQLTSEVEKLIAQGMSEQQALNALRSQGKLQPAAGSTTPIPSGQAGPTTPFQQPQQQRPNFRGMF